jgi:predicted acetyltransferase
VSEVVGFDRLDRIIGFKIAPSIYNGTNCGTKKNMEVLKAMEEMVAAYLKEMTEERKSERKAETKSTCKKYWLGWTQKQKPSEQKQKPSEQKRKHCETRE